CSSSEDPAKERSELEMLRGRQVDGVVIASAQGTGNADVLQQLVKRGTSLVMIDRDDHAAVKCHRVLTDDEQVGQLATSHLVVGVGDIALGDLLRVPLTTVGWSRREQGRHAAELLLNGIDREDDERQRVIIPPRLIVRESSGAAR